MKGLWRPLAQSCNGTDQISSVVSVYTDPESFDSLPTIPKQIGSGRSLCMVSYDEGRVLDIPGVQIASKLESYYAVELFVKQKQECKLTIDCYTMPGWVQLLHESDEQVEADYELIHDMCMRREFFICDTPQTPEEC